MDGTKEIVNVTKSSLPPFETFAEKIKPLWESCWLTNMGKYYKEFETELKEYMDVPYVSLMVNGHMALEMAIQAFKFPPNSEVITTPFTFISTTHAIVRNALVPVFCDIKSSDYTIDEGKIEKLITDKTVAIIPVHVYGNICDVETIDRIARRYNLKVIYDACHSFGESVDGIKVGNFGDASVFSFHATKVFNTIEGGAVTFSNGEMYERLYNLKNFGIRSEEKIVDIGANAKMNEFSAAMGLCNLPFVAENIKKRREKAAIYSKLLGNCRGIKQLPFRDRHIEYNYGYYPVLFQNKDKRNAVYEELKKENINSRKYFYPLTCDVECYRDLYGNAHDIDIARNTADNILVLPLYPDISEKNINKIVRIMRQQLEE